MRNHNAVKMMSNPTKTTEDQFIESMVVGLVAGNEKITTKAMTARGEKTLQK